MKLPRKTNQFWSSAIKLLVVSLSFIVIYKAIQEIPFAQWRSISDYSNLGQLLSLAVFFSFLNWSLESLKWKTLVDMIHPIQFWSAFSETLRAHAVSLITPNKIGEFGAKASFYGKPLRAKILKLTLSGQLYQLLATCFFGCIGLSVCFSQLPGQLKMTSAVSLVIILMLGFLLYYIKTSNQWFAKLKSYFKSLIKLSDVTNAKVFALSILRYLTFSHQFFLLLYLFQPELSYLQVMPILFVIYFISSVVPTFLLLDATLKAGLSLVLLNQIIASEFILLVNLLMWVFNFGVPAIIGNLLILKPRALSPETKKAL